MTKLVERGEAFTRRHPALAFGLAAAVVIAGRLADIWTVAHDVVPAIVNLVTGIFGPMLEHLPDPGPVIGTVLNIASWLMTLVGLALLVLVGNELRRSRHSAPRSPISASTVGPASPRSAVTAGPATDRVGPPVRGSAAALSEGSTTSGPVGNADEPPADWTGAAWKGKSIIRCPHDTYRTNDDAKFQEHMETHVDPPNEVEARRVSRTALPWAQVPIHFIGDGRMYTPDAPADPTITLFTPRARADELIRTGLYEEGPVPQPDLPILVGVPPEHRADKLREYEAERLRLIELVNAFINDLWAMSVAEASQPNKEQQLRPLAVRWENQVADFRQTWWPDDETLEQYLDDPGETTPQLAPAWRFSFARRAGQAVKWLKMKALSSG